MNRGQTRPLAVTALVHGEGMSPPQAGEPREVTVGADQLATVLDVSGGSTEQLVLESAVGGIPLFPVGDSRSVLAVDGQSLLLEDLTVTGDLRVLAENCTFGRVGEPGWGLGDLG